jgi:Ca2+-binding RTX toxin-like protein
MPALTLWSPQTTFAGGDQTVGALPTGGYAIAYSGSAGVQWRRFDASGGVAVGSTTLVLAGARPPVAALNGDGRPVVFLADISAGLNHLLLIGGEGQVLQDITIPFSQGGAFVDAKPLDDGRLLVTWEATIAADDPTSSNIYFQIFEADGSEATQPIRANATVPGVQLIPSIAVLTDGGFAMVWRDSNLGAQARVFEADGTPRSAELALPEIGAIGNFAPQAAPLEDGGFVLAWITSSVAYAQRYDADGVAMGGVITVGPAINGAVVFGTFLDVLGLPDGGFIVASTTFDGDGVGHVWLQRFDADGQPLDGPLEALRSEAGAGRRLAAPSLALLADGRIVVSATDDDRALVRVAIVDPREAGVSLAGSRDADDLWGTDFADTMMGGAGGDDLKGAGGDDRLDGGAGADRLAGGSGNDTYVVDNAGDLIVELVGGGTDTVETARSSYALAANVERLVGTSARAQSLTGNGPDNQITGGAANDHLYGLGGADILSGGAGADTMEGGAGDDVYYVENPSDVLVELAGEGTDTVYSCCDYTISGEVENLVLQTGAANGTGNASANRITGNGAANLLSGLGGADVLIGGTGDDTLLGGDDADRLEGGTGNDLLEGGAGADTLIGGTGNDTYVVDDPGDVIVEAASGGTDTVRAYASYVLSAGLENLELMGTDAIDGTGTALNNLLTGNDGHNVLQGLDGADVLNGAGGDDELRGGAGNDTLDGGEGADVLIGGDGYDLYQVDDGGDLIVETATGGLDKVSATASFVLADNVEQLTLAGAADLDGTGNVLANLIAGNAGANLLSGLAGADTLLGGAGDDRLDGGAGADKLTGGEGADVFVLGADAVHPTGAGGVMETDQILDLSFVDGDRIDLSGIDADAAAAGDQALVFVGAFSGHAGQATLTYVAASDTTLLRLDVDGDRKIDLQVKIAGDATGGTVLTGGEPAGVGGWLL